MPPTDMYVNERLDHLGIVAGVCQEIGLAAWLDAQDPSHRKPRERGNSNGRDDFERLGVQQPTIVFSATVLREQTGRATARVLGSRPRCSTTTV
jgi:hypothetical protein